MKKIIELLYHRPNQWCNAHKTPILIGVVVEMVLLIPMALAHAHLHDARSLRTDLASEAVCAVLLVTMLVQINRRKSSSKSQ